MADAEEEDDEVCDSWEDMADSGELERRMEERSKQQMEKEEKNVEFSNTNVVPVVIQEDTNRTLYKPQLRILKRPDSGDQSQRNMGQKSEKPVHKTLAERQAQYAEARARILGSACDGSEDADSSDVTLDGDICCARPFTLQLASEEKPSDCIVRQPLGPDGTSGFQKKR